MSDRYAKFILKDMAEKHGEESDSIDFSKVPAEEKKQYDDLMARFKQLTNANVELDRQHFGKNFNHYEDASEMLANKGPEWLTEHEKK